MSSVITKVSKELDLDGDFNEKPCPVFEPRLTDEIRKSFKFDIIKYEFIRIYLKLQSDAKNDAEKSETLQELDNFLNNKGAFTLRIESFIKSINKTDFTVFLVGNRAPLVCERFLKCKTDLKMKERFLQYVKAIQTENLTLGAIASKEMVQLANEKGYKERVSDLLKEGADLSYKNIDGRNALHVAALFGHTEVVEKLLPLVKDINEVDRDGYTALHLAAANGRTGLAGIVSLLIKAKASIHIHNKRGDSVLFSAIMSAEAGMVDQLITEGADVNHLNSDGYSLLTPLFLKRNSKFEYAFETILKTLLKNGIAIDPAKEGPVSWHGEDVTDSLRYSDCRMLISNAEEFAEVAETTLKELDKKKHLMSHQYYLDKLKDALNFRLNKHQGDGILHLAIRNHNIPLMLKLLIKRVNTNLQNYLGETPLDLMISSSVPCIKSLGLMMKIQQITNTVNEASTSGPKEKSAEETKELLDSESIRSEIPKAVASLIDKLPEDIHSHLKGLIKNLAEISQNPPSKDMFYYHKDFLDYICYDVGKYLAGLQTKITKDGLKETEENLNPLDAVKAYNVLGLINENEVNPLFARANTIQSFLILQGHIPFLEKSPDYPNGPYIAVSSSSSSSAEEYETNKAQALYEHVANSDETNPHKEAAGNLLMARFFPTGLPQLSGFLNMKQTADMRQFCYKMDELIAERIEKAVSEALAAEKLKDKDKAIKEKLMSAIDIPKIIPQETQPKNILIQEMEKLNFAPLIEAFNRLCKVGRTDIYWYLPATDKRRQSLKLDKDKEIGEAQIQQLKSTVIEALKRFQECCQEELNSLDSSPKDKKTPFINMARSQPWFFLYGHLNPYMQEGEFINLGYGKILLEIDLKDPVNLLKMILTDTPEPRPYNIFMKVFPNLRNPMLLLEFISSHEFKDIYFYFSKELKLITPLFEKRLILQFMVELKNTNRAECPKNMHLILASGINLNQSLSSESCAVKAKDKDCESAIADRKWFHFFPWEALKEYHAFIFQYLNESPDKTEIRKYLQESHPKLIYELILRGDFFAANQLLAFGLEKPSMKIETFLKEAILLGLKNSKEIRKYQAFALLAHQFGFIHDKSSQFFMDLFQSKPDKSLIDLINTLIPKIVSHYLKEYREPELLSQSSNWQDLNLLMLKIEQDHAIALSVLYHMPVHSTQTTTECYSGITIPKTAMNQALAKHWLEYGHRAAIYSFLGQAYYTSWDDEIEDDIDEGMKAHHYQLRTRYEVFMKDFTEKEMRQALEFLDCYWKIFHAGKVKSDRQERGSSVPASQKYSEAEQVVLQLSAGATRKSPISSIKDDVAESEVVAASAKEEHPLKIKKFS